MRRSEEFKDYYAVLGISPDADQEHIGRAYRRLIKAIHPDARGGEVDPTAGRRVAELTEAWKVLGDRAKRAAYDDLRRARLSGSAARASGGEGATLPPVLMISPKTLDLGTVTQGEVAFGRVRVENQGGRATSLQRLSPLPEWLSLLQPRSGGSALSFPLELGLRVDTRGLLPRRTHRAEVTFRLSDGTEDSQSHEETLVIQVAVASQTPPRTVVRPGGWVVKQSECEGAPHSLVLHLSVANEGGARLTGSIEASPWIRVSSARFGPLGKDSQQGQSVLVEIDCQAWKAAGWRDGAVWVMANGFDRREAVLALREAEAVSSLSDRLDRVSWWATSVVGLSLAPALILVLGLPASSWAILIAAALALPALLDRIRHWQIVSLGPGAEARGWDLGPAEGNAMLCSTGMAWALLGALLGTATAGELLPLPDSSTSFWLGAAAGATGGLSLAARQSLLRPMICVSGPLRWGTRALLGAAIAGAWALLLGMAAHGILGGWGSGYGAWGGVPGWMVGIGIVVARSGALPEDWQKRAIAIIWGLAPLLGGGLGFSAGLLMAVGGVAPPDWFLGSARAVAFNSASASSSLMALPEASLRSALTGVVACVGLLLGAALGALSVVPTLKTRGFGGRASRAERPIVGWILGFLTELLESYSFPFWRQWNPHDTTGWRPFGTGRPSVPWEIGVVACAFLLLLIYSAAHLLLAMAAFVGIAIGG